MNPVPQIQPIKYADENGYIGDLAPCELERKRGRDPSGRRSCKFSDIPCGMEDSAGCSVLARVNGNLRVKAEFMKNKKLDVKKRRRGRVGL